MCVIIILDSLFGSRSLCMLKSGKRSPEKQIKRHIQMGKDKNYIASDIRKLKYTSTLRVIRFFF